MIKVNLLKDQTVRVHKSFAKQKVSRIGLIYIAIFLITGGIMGTWHMIISRQIDSRTITRDKLRRDETRLQNLKVQVASYEKLKQQCQNRIDLIEKLKGNQSGPVLLLNTIIQGIPRNHDFWLTNLEQKEGSVQIVGLTRSPETIPALLTNLTTSGIFASVDLEVVERQDDVSKFSISCLNINKSKAELKHGSK
jgi:Tfp pilus assembly protein PilN